jgi:hypothetical protein
VVEKNSTGKKSQPAAGSRQTVTYQTLDDLNYEPPGDISAKSGEVKTITKPESSCRLTKIAITCSHADDAKGDTGQKSSAEKKGDEEDNAVRVDPSLYKTVPFQVVAPVSPKTTKGFAAKYAKAIQAMELGQNGKVTKWVNEKLTKLHKTAGTVHKKAAEWNDKIGKKDEVKSETIMVTIEGYFCEDDHPKVTVKEVGREKKKSDTVADIGKDEKEVEVLDGSPPKGEDGDKKKDGEQAGDKDSKKTSDKEDKGSTSSAKEESSEPVLTTKECWFKVGSLMPKYKSVFFLTNYVHPRYVSPNIYEVHVETCKETRIILVEAFYNARWEVEFGRVVRGKSDDSKESDDNAIATYDGSVKTLKEEIQCWQDALKSSKSGSFLKVLYTIARVVKTLLEDYKLTLKQRGHGPRVKKEISTEQLLKLATSLEALDKSRKSLEDKEAGGESSWEFPGGHELECKLMAGSYKSNWYHREKAGRLVEWYYDVAVNLKVIEAEYVLTVNVAPSWAGGLKLSGTGKLAISVEAKGNYSSDAQDKVVAFWKARSGKTIAWWQKKDQKEQKSTKGDEETSPENKVDPGIREGIPIKGECQPEVELEIPVFVEELFNLSPKAEGGLKAGGFVGFDEHGPCVRLGLDIEDLKVSVEISALGGWISFTLGPVPIIPLEALSKKAGESAQKRLGVGSLVGEGEIRFPALPKKDDPLPDITKVSAKS